MRKITDNTLGLNFDIVIRLWLFADRREIPLIMNDMISCLKRIVVEQGILPIDQVGLVYEKTLAGSPLRRMLIHTMSNLSDPGTSIMPSTTIGLRKRCGI